MISYSNVVPKCFLWNLFLHHNHTMTAILSGMDPPLELATTVAFVFQNITASGFSQVFISPDELESLLVL